MSEGRPIEKVREALRAHGSRQDRTGKWNCPVPNHGKGSGDQHASLSVREDGEKVIIKCFAGCERDKILGALGLSWEDLYPQGRKRGEGRSTPPRTRAPVQPRVPLTLADYAAAKQLPIEELRRYGLTDAPFYPGGAAVCVAYFDTEGQVLARRFRLTLEKRGGIDDRFRWRKGSKVHPYGLWKLAEAREKGYVVLVEGESDCHTLWHHGEPALGIPGVDTWRNEWSRHVEDIPTVCLVVEPDFAGAALRDKVGGSSLGDRLKLIDLGDQKDPSGLHLADAEGFRTAWKAFLASAVPYRQIQQAQREQDRSEFWGRCQHLATQPRILSVFEEAYRATGAVGNGPGPKVTYLA